MFHSFALRLNAKIEKFMPLLTPTGVLLGFLLGSRISGLAPAVTWLFAFITFSGALGMNARDFLHVIKRPVPIFTFLFMFHVVIPVTVRLLAGFVFPGERELVTGFVLLFSIPTAVAGYIWTSIHKGNGPLALTLILIDTILAPILTPATVSFLMNTSVSIDSTGMFISLVWMVVIPSIIGILINQGTKGSVPKAVTPFFKPLSKLVLLAVIAINSSRVAGSITVFEPIFVLVIVASIFLSFGGYLAGAVAARLAGLERKDQITTMYAIGMRNISAALVLALNFFPARAAIPVITGILFQQTLAAISGVVLVQKLVNNDNGNRHGKIFTMEDKE